MKTLLPLALALVLAGLVPPVALAQTAAPTVQGNARADAYVGRSIVNPAGEAIGRIETVLIDDAGQVRHLIVVPALGGSRVALDPGALTPRPDGQGYLASLRPGDLALLPAYPQSTPSGVLYIDRAAVAREFAPIVARPVFEEVEVRARLQDQGYRSITNLTQDDQMTWSANAVAPDGRQVRVQLDAQGAITVR